tara:strand:+ start:6294 stop:6959 length:666 start_codon:yes stop_codon:yes gene_type:complete
LKVSAIIPAAGLGNRFGEAKQFKLLAGTPLFIHSIKAFLNSSKIHEIVVVVPKDKQDSIYKAIMSISGDKRITITSGGERRQDSVKNGVLVSDTTSDLICIHDAARPFITETLIQDSINSCKLFDGAVIAIPSVDTVKYSENNIIMKTIDRNSIWLAQTPQVFWKDKLLKAYDGMDESIEITDEASIMEKMGYKICLVPGDIKNNKITTFEDWKYAESRLK